VTVNVVLLIGLMLADAMLGAGLLGVAIERFAYRPLRNAPRIAPLISALGVSFFLQSSALLLFGADFRSYETYEYIDLASGIHWGPLNISVVRIAVILTAVALMLG
jgi:branched-chain amino acid transport system permease protein